MPLSNITLIIRKIFDDYDEKNGAQQKTDYTQRAENIVQTWTQSMAKEGLTTQLICELHRLVCEDEWIPINDPKGGISGFAKAGEYRTTPSSAPSSLHKGSRTLFLAPSDIPSRMQYLVQTMNGVFHTNPPKETMIENIVAFTVEILTIHPFANQNGRLAQVMMELFAFQAGIEPFNISFVCKRDYPQICKSCEEVIALQSTVPFVRVINSFYKSAEIDFEKYLEQTK